MEPTNHLDNEKLVELTRVYNDVEANMIHSLLAESGIESLLVGHVPHSVYPFTVNGLGEVRVKVLESQLEQAREVLRESGRFQLSDEMDSDQPDPDQT